MGEVFKSKSITERGGGGGGFQKQAQLKGGEVGEVFKKKKHNSKGGRWGRLKKKHN